jgi:ornithine cyclodeaminase
VEKSDVDSTVRVVTSADAEGLITQREANAAVAAAYEELGQGRAFTLPRSRLYIPLEDPSEYHTHNSVVGAVPGCNTLALRLDEIKVRFTDRDDGGRGMTHPGDYAGFVLLFRIDTRELYGIVHDHALSSMRVAATSAIVSRRMARIGATTLGVLGSGQQAESAVLAHLAEIPSLKRVQVYSRSSERREAMARRLGAEAQIEAAAVATPHEAVREADILVTATDSFSPTFKGEWLEAGQHVTSIVNSDYFVRKSEVDDLTVQRAGTVILNSKQYARSDRQPEIAVGLRNGWFTWEDLVEVADVACRRIHGRTSATEITLHLNNGGMGIQFAAVGALMLERAAKRDVGTLLPSELFMTRRTDGQLAGP